MNSSDDKATTKKVKQEVAPGVCGSATIAAWLAAAAYLMVWIQFTIFRSLFCALTAAGTES